MNRVIMLVGAQGSGKTFYCQENLKGYVRISQDDQGKEGHKALYATALAKGEPLIVIDRINHSRMQRGNYLALAKRHGYSTKIVWINVPRHVCLQRIKDRKGHPTLKPEDAEAGLSIFYRGFQTPSKREADELEVVGSPPEFVPVKDLTAEIGNRRFVIVGDIHGCLDELQELLKDLGFDPKEDVLVSTGDLVDRGPKIRETLEFVMSLPRFYACMGNHDDKCVRHFSGNAVKIAHGLQNTIDAFGGKMPEKVLEFLRNLPLILKTPTGYVVHAGFDPLLSAEEQRREDCIYMRYCGGKSYFDSENGTLWYKLWDGAKTFFGHIPEPSCPVLPKAVSLDGGCVFGDYLKAWDSQTNVVHYVKAKQAYSVSEFQQAQGVAGDEIRKREEYVVAGLLRKDVTDDGRLAIYTYTDQCTFDGAWDNITRNSRGHIFDLQTGECVARPFGKFFNLGENEDSLQEKFDWKKPYHTLEKLDGWLVILFRHEGKFKIASRGSFHSDGANWASAFIEKYDLSFLPDEATLCFELINPAQKIILDYGAKQELVVLAAFNRHTAAEYPRTTVEEWAQKAGLTIVKRHEFGIEECLRIQKEEKGREGFVLVFEDGRRVRVKTEWYRALAKIMAHMSPIALWEAMRDGKVQVAFLARIPEELRPAAEQYTSMLETQYSMVKENIFSVSSAYIAKHGGDRKKVALDRDTLKGTWSYKAVFSVLDKNEKALDKAVMGIIYPSANEFAAIKA